MSRLKYSLHIRNGQAYPQCSQLKSVFSAKIERLYDVRSRNK